MPSINSQELFNRQLPGDIVLVSMTNDNLKLFTVNSFVQRQSQHYTPPVFKKHKEGSNIRAVHLSKIIMV